MRIQHFETYVNEQQRRELKLHVPSGPNNHERSRRLPWGRVQSWRNRTKSLREATVRAAKPTALQTNKQRPPSFRINVSSAPRQREPLTIILHTWRRLIASLTRIKIA